MKNFSLNILFYLLASVFVFKLSAESFPVRPLSDLSGTADIYSDVRLNYLVVFARDSVLLKADPKTYNTEVEIDSTFRFVTLYERIYDQDVRTPRTVKIDDFIKMRLNYENRNIWLISVNKNLGIETSSLLSGDEIALDIPFKIKSKTFHRVFGGNNIGLRVKGSLSISIIGQKSYTDLPNAENESFDFTLDQTQNISIRGKVGTKVDVDIAQNTESFDFENSLKITYTGESDEIIQKLEAGNIGLSLPGTRYVSFSGVNKGLFGLKAETKIGNLKSTSIMSFEKGKKNQIHAPNGVSNHVISPRADEFERYKYFFIDEDFRENMGSAANFQNLTEHTALETPLYKIKNYSFQLFITRSSTGTRYNADIYIDFLNRNDSLTIGGVDNLYETSVVKLVEDDEYEINYELGYIRLKSLNLSGDEILAARYIKQNKTNTSQQYSVGSIDSTGTKLELQILGQCGQDPSNPWDKLEWKNVYSLGGVDISADEFKLTVQKKEPTGVKTEEYDSSGNPKSYLYWFDISDPEVHDEVDIKFLNQSKGEFIFPSLTPFMPDPATSVIYREAASDTLFTEPFIYTNTSSSYTTSDFNLKFEFFSKSSTYPLGFNVIEGSEVVRSGATTLVKDVDYVINYNSGDLTIINERYLTADIDILYESATLFQLDQKMLLGNRLEYSFGKNSYIGATVLYLSEETNEERVHVGYEPKQNLVLDLNGQSDFDLPFLTKAVDWLPLIETDKESNISFEGEIAQIIPNPNPLGAAYIDDFENSKIKKTLGISYGSWTEASFPDEYSTFKNYSLLPEVDSLGIPFQYFLKSYSGSEDLSFYWYNPKDENKYIKDQIYNDVPGDQKNDKVNTLNIVFTPSVSNPAFEDENINAADSWGGVMRYLYSGYQDMREIKYIEFLASASRDITLNIDIGDLSEDVIPNGDLNTEDFKYENNVLDVGSDSEDVGVDQISGDNDYHALTDPEGREKKFYEFFSFDNHPAQDGSPTPDSQIGNDWDFCKTENNGKLDSEDLDGSNDVDRSIRAYRYTINLKSDPGLDNEYVVSVDFGSDFALYRIPVKDFKTYLNKEPDLSRMKYIKLWLNNAKDDLYPSKVDFVSFDLVGNEWAAKGDNIGLVEPKTINNEEDKERYQSPPGVKRYDDNGNLEPEQSLALSISLTDNLSAYEYENPGRYAFLTKKINEGENYLLYEQLKMFVHGGTPALNTEWDEERSLYFIYRFGTDSVNYYEYRSKLVKGWKSDLVNNQMVIELTDLTNLKTSRSDTGSPVDSIYLVNYKDDNIKRYIGIRGNPTLQSVKFFNAGILDSAYTELNTEIWIDELRLAKVTKETGMAMRAKTHIQVADVGTIDAEVTKQDEEFHRIEENKGSGVNQLSTSFNTSLNLDKLTPKKWGLSLPVRYSYNNADSYTKYQGTTDILVDKDNIPDSVRTRTTRNQYDFSIRKTSKSNSPYLKYTLDNLSLTGNASFSDASNPSYISQKTEAYNYNLGYSLGLPDSWFSFSPFGWGKDISFFKSISGVKFAFFPNSYNFSIQSGQSETVSLSRRTNATPTASRSFLVTRNFSTSLTPLPFITSNYSLSLKSDMYKKAVETNRLDTDTVITVYNRDIGDLFKLDFGELTSFDNTLKNNVKINASKYLTNDLSYNTGYNWTGNLTSAIPSSNIKNRYDSKLNSRIKVKEIIGSVQAGISNIFPEKKISDNRDQKDSVKVVTEEDKKQSGASRLSRTSTASSGKKKSILDFIKNNLSDIALSYSQGRENSFSDIKSLDQANPLFMLGFSSEPEDENYSSSSWSGNWGMSGNTRLSLTKNLSFDGISYQFTRSYRQNNNEGFTGSDSETKFIWPWVTDEEHRKTGANPLILPNYSITISGLKDLLQAKESISSLTITHSKSGSETKSWYIDGDAPGMYLTGIPDLAGSDLRIRSVGYATGFSPLAGISLSLKNGLSFSANYNYSFDMKENYIYNDENKSIQSGDKKYTRELRVSAGYNQKGGFDVPFNFWPFNGKRLDNDITYNLSVTYNSNDTHKYDIELKEYEGLDNGIKSDNFTVSPDITYKISRKLNGTISYSYNYNESKSYEARSIVNTNHKFELRAVLSITGR